MKKLFLLLLVVFLAGSSFAEESRLFINPGRETFVNFPSKILGNKYTVSFFLPENAVPLSRRYPVAYVLGLSPKQQATAMAFAKEHHVLVVGVNFTEKDYQNKTKLMQFVTRELVPYVDTNYLTQGDDARLLVARGKAGTSVASSLFAKPNLFTGLYVLAPESAIEILQIPHLQARVLVAGTQAELAAAQVKLEGLGLAYGTGFALEYAGATGILLDVFDADYLLAPAQDVRVARVNVLAGTKELSVRPGSKTILRGKVELANGKRFDYVPGWLRLSPPYLDWNASEGTLTVRAGAEPKTVKIRGNVDKKDFLVKIRLKKQ